MPEVAVLTSLPMGPVPDCSAPSVRGVHLRQVDGTHNEWPPEMKPESLLCRSRDSDFVFFISAHWFPFSTPRLHTSLRLFPYSTSPYSSHHPRFLLPLCPFLAVHPKPMRRVEKTEYCNSWDSESHQASSWNRFVNTVKVFFVPPCYRRIHCLNRNAKLRAKTVE